MVVVSRSSVTNVDVSGQYVERKWKLCSKKEWRKVEPVLRS